MKFKKNCIKHLNVRCWDTLSCHNHCNTPHHWSSKSLWLYLSNEITFSHKIFPHVNLPQVWVEVWWLRFSYSNHSITPYSLYGSIYTPLFRVFTCLYVWVRGLQRPKTNTLRIWGPKLRLFVSSSWKMYTSFEKTFSQKKKTNLTNLTNQTRYNFY